MSSNFIPILSTSPPPLADEDDDSTDDDFGDYTSAYDDSTKKDGWLSALSPRKEQTWSAISQKQECRVTTKNNHYKNADISTTSIKHCNLETFSSYIESGQTDYNDCVSEISSNGVEEGCLDFRSSPERCSTSFLADLEDDFSVLKSNNFSPFQCVNDTNNVTPPSPILLGFSDSSNNSAFKTAPKPLELSLPVEPDEGEISSVNDKLPASAKQAVESSAEALHNTSAGTVSCKHKEVDGFCNVETDVIFTGEEMHNEETLTDDDSLGVEIDERNQNSEDISDDDDEFCDFAQADYKPVSVIEELGIVSSQVAIINSDEKASISVGKQIRRNSGEREFSELSLESNFENSDVKLYYYTFDDVSSEKIDFNDPEQLPNLEDEKNELDLPTMVLKSGLDNEKEIDIEDLSFEPFVDAVEETSEIPDLRSPDESENNIAACSSRSRNCDPDINVDTLDFRDDGEFADFSDFQNNAERWSDSEEFADFESAKIDTTVGSDVTTLLPEIDTKLGVHSLEQLINGCFPDWSPKFCDDDVESLDVVLYIPEDHVPTNPRGKCVWPDLHDTEKTHALQYHWNSSRCNKKLLTALNVDARNIFQMLGPRMIGQFQDLPTTGHSLEVIPPAQFDWSSSGLTNPLDDASNAMLTLLDLEYFSTLEEGNRQTVHSRISCLERELLSKQEYQPPAQRNQLFEQMMISGVFSSSQHHRPSSPLSSEVRAILDKLPKLNFMQGRVLMFPMRASTPT